MTADIKIRTWLRPLALVIFAALSLKAQNLSEYHVKAAFMVNFTKFTDWPGNAFESPQAPLNICILGEDPFGTVIDQLAEGEVIKGHRIVILRAKALPLPRTCHVLFLSRSERNIGPILMKLGPGVLTVSDRERFLLEGGMIAMAVEGDHVRFDVNQRAALRASLTVNARLLNVARRVEK